ncbi:aminotransferase class I/II-fold pyridoxal phosphate-dependent enzyme [Cognatiyoonia sp. IB215446]|uniref:aminotransferase class I/II-fold pyridoxal phosphate-dependent enzyme n=1 Tax=Cognatiyoonia sp. IB215446 TaxID=3097355 RepID=UPI002A13A5AF|nr:aminotransferase class I/II-fold pyridoxal phosphate-dependent enzyme [Cognatiyoonia sp. IB215446]MDX8347733.1 aminotransferase class I/II-fold pyridoxal phosphate-dependent enzyme [Cognatiyoonia sp. IB215446]
MYIEPFGIELWMDAWETRCTYNLAETCVESLTIADLLALAGQEPGDLLALSQIKMTYGDIRGSARLLHAISALYERQDPANIIVTHGTIGANMLVYKALIGAGDRVVTVVPTYQQHFAIPASLGAEVVKLPLRRADDYQLDLDALRDAVTPGTKMIALTNPNNPTGALMDRSVLEGIAAIAREVGAYILCDEVYRGTDQEGDGTTASIADIYEKGISTAGMSKAFALAGLRLGWVAGPEDVISAVAHHRDYDTISVGKLDDHFATLALENKGRVLARSRQITQENLTYLADWVSQTHGISWVQPQSGTVTLLDYDLPLGSEELCTRLMTETGVLLAPGAVFEVEGTVRIGFANPKADLQAGLAEVSAFLARA